jgi:monoamine oxidase
MFGALRRAIGLARLSGRLGLDPAGAVERAEGERLSRREALRAASALATGLGLGLNPSRPAVAAEVRARRGGPRVAVVGAGIAGLVTAWELGKGGVLADVYEAGQRTGGRVLSVAGLVAPGVVTDLGGEFIDTGHKAMRRLVGDLGLGLVDTFADPQPGLKGEAFFFEGAHHGMAQLVAEFRPFVAEMAEDYDDVGDDPDDFIGNDDARELDRLSVAEYLDGVGLKRGWLRTFLDVALTLEYGLEPGELSALNLMILLSPDLSDGTFRVYGESDERYKVRGGSQAVTDALAARLPGRVEFGHRLEAVRPVAGTGGLRLVFAVPGGRTREVSADAAVLAVPFSVLRGIEIGVDLPPLQARAVAELGYGTNAKLVAGFSSRPWGDGGYRGAVFSDEPFQSAWDGSRLQNDPAGPAALTLFLGGRAGVAVGRGTAQEQVARLLPGVDRAYPGVLASFNGKADRYHWPTAPFALGSYSCYKPGQWTTLAGSEGKRVGNLYFAGEHCPYGLAGYMDSAVISARRTARSLLARVNTG